MKIVALIIYTPLVAIGFVVGFLSFPIVAGFVMGYDYILKRIYSDFENDVKAHLDKENY